MKKMCMALAAGLAAISTIAPARGVEVSIDASSAKAVLAALRDPMLGMDEALRIARLPGNQGLIRKSRSYGRRASDATLAQALVAAAHRDATFVDPSGFHFEDLQGHAAETERAVDRLSDPNLHLLDSVRSRIAEFTPTTLDGRVTGYLIAGGTSGGFAFGEPQFFLNVDRFPSATIAASIMEHELYHAVQALARSGHAPATGRASCTSAAGRGSEIAAFLDSLSQEGTASYVGDVLALPEHDPDPWIAKERERFARNVGMVNRSIVQLELSVHGLATGAAVTPDEVYALGFYGDEVLYPLGYVMARAIAAEQGDAAIGELSGDTGAAFIRRYAHLRAYGASKAVPALKPETVEWAETLSGCATRAE